MDKDKDFYHYLDLEEYFSLEDYTTYKSYNFNISSKIVNDSSVRVSFPNGKNVKEVIIAVKPSIEGETTSLYISKILEKKDLIVTRIALGIPLGADMDYVDSLTLELALENRKKINNN